MRLFDQGWGQDQASVDGSYISAEERGPVRPSPPTTSTLPSSRSVTVWFQRLSTMLPARDQVSLDKSYISTEERGSIWRMPPVTRTLPSPSSAAA